MQECKYAGGERDKDLLVCLVPSYIVNRILRLESTPDQRQRQIH